VHALFSATSQYFAKMSAHTTSIDIAPQLVGKLCEDGTAQLEQDTIYTKGNSSRHSQSLKDVLEGSTHSSQNGSDNGSESTSEEDYDSLKHDPLTVVSGGRGGGYENVDELNKPKSYEEIRTSSGSPSSPTRRKSIPIKLNKLEEDGRYMLTADDAALTEILKTGLEREKNTGSAKSRQKFRDLVFTRQFTAFDRQNSESADSPFHGFFTLFW